MNFDKFTDTYIKINGIADRRNFVAAIMLTLSLLAMLSITSLRMFMISVPRETGLLGLLDIIDSGVIVTSLDIFPIMYALEFLIIYILFVTTVKYCRKLEFRQWQCFSLGALVIFPAVFFCTLSTEVIISFRSEDVGLGDWILILTAIAGLAAIVYLYTFKTDETARASNNDKFTNRMIIICLIFIILMSVSTSSIEILAESKFPLNTIFTIAFILVYAYMVFPIARKRWNKLPNVWILVAVFFFLEVIHNILIFNKVFETETQILMNSLMTLVESAFKLLLLALLLPVMEIPTNENDITN